MKYLKIHKITIAALLFMLLNICAKAQIAGGEPEMADLMRSNGKIYVVVAVITIIFLGIVVYLVSLNRKLNRLEKLMKVKDADYEDIKLIKDR
jgi:CcmD family protein